MNNISNFLNHCCGCGLCSKVCKKKAINMRLNENGFLYPVVNHELCVDCGICLKSCQFNKEESSGQVLKSFVAKNKNTSVRNASRSGGVFTALSDIVLAMGGVVYGCALEENMLVRHERAGSTKERDAFLGSKYIQSTILDCYDKVLTDLNKGRTVLFSGTPCQIDALKAYCGSTASDKLLLVDIVCFGVPGNKIWLEYKEYLENKTRSKMTKAVFRDKIHFGWEDHIEVYSFENKNTCVSNIYAKLFESQLILRKSCFECSYKNLNRVGDLTLGDAWGIKERFPDFNDNMGVSLILVNSEKGYKIFNQAKGSLDYIVLTTLDGFMQPCLQQNWSMPEKYEEFWRDVNTLVFRELFEKYLGDDITFRVISNAPRWKSILSKFCSLFYKDI